MPRQTVEVYEALRTHALGGGGRGRAGFTALLYHGMAQGLTLIAPRPATPEPRPETQASTLPAAVPNPALVRLLANMVLRIQSEVQHVY